MDRDKWPANHFYCGHALMGNVLTIQRRSFVCKRLLLNGVDFPAPLLPTMRCFKVRFRFLMHIFVTVPGLKFCWHRASQALLSSLPVLTPSLSFFVISWTYIWFWSLCDVSAGEFNAGNAVNTALQWQVLNTLLILFNLRRQLPTVMMSYNAGHTRHTALW